MMYDVNCPIAWSLIIDKLQYDYVHVYVFLQDVYGTSQSPLIGNAEFNGDSPGKHIPFTNNQVIVPLMLSFQGLMRSRPKGDWTKIHQEAQTPHEGFTSLHSTTSLR